MIKKDSFIISGSQENKILIDVYFKNNSTKKDVVIFSHGFKGFKDWGPFNNMAKSFALEGFFFIKFNFSYNGTSLSNPTEFVDLNSFGNNNFSIELDDLNNVLNWIISNTDFNQQINKNRINLFGHSRGGGISILKANEDIRINKVVSWASPSNFIKRMDESKLDTWKNEGVAYIFNSRTNQNMPLFYQFYEDCIKNKSRIDIENASRNLNIPHLAIHGSEDPTVHIDEVYDFQKWNSKTIVKEIKGANHVFGVSHPYDDKQYPMHFNKALELTFDFLKS